MPVVAGLLVSFLKDYRVRLDHPSRLINSNPLKCLALLLQLHASKKCFLCTLLPLKKKCFGGLSSLTISDLDCRKSVFEIIQLELQQDGRLPAEYFAPSHFRDGGFQKDENVFSRKNTLSSSYFLIFPTFKVV